MPDTFRHEAVFYYGIDEFVDAATAFVEDAIATGEPVLVVVSRAKIERLKVAVDAAPHEVQFVDMATVGQNPARIIPAWRDFVDKRCHEGAPVRGIGEPIWVERSAAELAECHRHESLLNLAFAGAPAWWLLCLYDTASLLPSVLAEARRNHPVLWERGVHRLSTAYACPSANRGFDAPLPEPRGTVEELTFDMATLGAVRQHVAWASGEGFSRSRRNDLVLAVSELATNSISHGGGVGTLRTWRDGTALVVEVRDRGTIADPMVGRVRPTPEQISGRGLWLVNQICDLVEIRSCDTANVVRVHMQTAMA